MVLYDKYIALPICFSASWIPFMNPIPFYPICSPDSSANKTNLLHSTQISTIASHHIRIAVGGERFKVDEAGEKITIDFLTELA